VHTVCVKTDGLNLLAVTLKLDTWDKSRSETGCKWEQDGEMCKVYASILISTQLVHALLCTLPPCLCKPPQWTFHAHMDRCFELAQELENRRHRILMSDA